MTSSRSTKAKSRSKRPTVAAKVKAAADTVVDSGIDLASGLVMQASDAIATYEVLNIFVRLATRYEGEHDSDPHAPNWQPGPDPIGIITVGYGRALRHPEENRFLIWARTDDRRIANEMFPEGVTKEEAMIMLLGDARERLAFLRTQPAFMALNPPQQASILDFTYNLGIRNYKKSTLFELIEAQQFDFDPIDPQALWDLTKRKVKPLQLDEAFAVYSRATGANGIRRTFTGLFARRLAELFTFDGTPVDEAIARADEIADKIEE